MTVCMIKVCGNYTGGLKINKKITCYRIKMLLLSVLMMVSHSEQQFKDTNYWDNRSTMLHLFEWKWLDIAQECEEFLAPHGFGGIQISPPNENLIIPDRPWWERYQPMSYTLTTRSGSEEEFLEMTERCNAVGVRIYADAVFNHMTGEWDVNVGTAGSVANFTDRSYPGVPYEQIHFHSPECLLSNYLNATEVRVCDLTYLKDLNQTNEYVQEKIVNYLNYLIERGVAGFRIDAAKHMYPQDIETIYSRLNNLNVIYGFAPNTRPYIFQEVIDYGGEGVKYDEYTSVARVTEFKYGMELSRCFNRSNPIKYLKNFGEDWNFLKRSDAMVFIDNHDTQRSNEDILNYKSSKAYKAAVAFMLAHPYGEVKMISSYGFTDIDTGPPADANGNTISPSFKSDGTCGNGWICEHRWREMFEMVAFRNAVKGTGINDFWYGSDYQISFCRGGSGFIAFNLESKDLKQDLETCLPAGTYCDVISGSKVNNSCNGKTISVKANGRANIEIKSTDPDYHLAIHVGPESRLS